MRGRWLLLALAVIACLAPQLASDAAYVPIIWLGDFMPGAPANSAIMRFGLPGPIELPVGLPPGAVCIAKVAATASTTVTLNKVSGGTTTAIGTLVWAAAATTCTVTFSAAVTFAAQDVLEEAYPATADTTLADITITIPGFRLPP